MRRRAVDAARDEFRCRALQRAGEQQHDQDNQDQAGAARGVIAPARAVRPCRSAPSKITITTINRISRSIASSIRWFYDNTRNGGSSHTYGGKPGKIGGFGERAGAQSANGSRTKIVSSRSGLVESSATGVSINSSMRRTYLTASAGNCDQLRAPRVLSLQPSMVS